jgi:hypothetical protein
MSESIVSYYLIKYTSEVCYFVTTFVAHILRQILIGIKFYIHMYDKIEICINIIYLFYLSI